MKQRYLPGVVAFIFILSLFACAPRFAVLHNPKDIPSDPRIRHGILSNGFQYLLVKNATPENRVNVHLNIFAGSVHESDDQQGLAHYLEHMLFNGSTHFKPGELINYFQRIGMDFGGDANAHTSFFNTTYDLSLPHGDKKQLDEAFIVIEDYARGALLLQEEIERERGIILAEKRERDSVSYRTFKKSIAFELPGSLLAKRLPIGIEPVLKKAGRKELKAYYDKWYRPDNMALVVVGDVDETMAETLIKKRFSKMGIRSLSSGTRTPDIAWTPHQGLNAFYHHEPEAGSTEVTIETITQKPFAPQTIEDLQQQTLQSLVNIMLQNRLSRMVSKQTADFSHASVYSGRYLRYLSASAIQATCEKESWKESLGQIEGVLRQALLHGFTKKELERVKADYINKLETDFKQSTTQKSSDIARKLLSRINRKSLLLSAEQRKNILKSYIESVSILNADKALKKDWSPDHRLILVTGNADIKDSQPENTILNAYRTALKNQVLPHAGFQSKAFPYLSIAQARSHALPVKKGFKNVDITQYAYENNVVLNLKKTDFEKNKILFKVRFGTGKAAAPASKQGLAFLSERIVQQSGLGSLDTDQLEEAMAGKEISYQFDIREDYFSISGSADPSETELLFQLIYHFMNDPGFREESLQLVKTRYQQDYEGLLRTPEGMMQLKGHQFLAGGDFRFGLPSPSQMSSYTLADIKNWLNPHFKTSPIEVSIVGDFDKDKLTDLAHRYLGAFSQRKNSDTVRLDELKLDFAAGQQQVYKLNTKIDTAVVRLCFLTDDFWDISQTRRLSMLSRVISERLRLVIREKLGVAYSPYAYNAPSQVFDQFGIFHIVVQVKPGQQDFVLGKLKQIVSDIIENGITHKETQLALKPVQNHIKVLRSNNRYWLNSVMTNSFIHPQKFEWATQMPADYESITSDELWHLAKKYLRAEKSAVIFIASEK